MAAGMEAMAAAAAALRQSSARSARQALTQGALLYRHLLVVLRAH